VQPGSGDQYTIAAKPGDVFVLASDGVYDNLSEDAIVAVANEDGQLKLLASIAKRGLTEVCHAGFLFCVRPSLPFTVFPHRVNWITKKRGKLGWSLCSMCCRSGAVCCTTPPSTLCLLHS
jgi:sulfur transfer complex TusBCD TusB component (DsrH family)